MSPRLAFALEAAVRAGRSTLAHFLTGTHVSLKEDDSPVTVADREPESIIRAMLADAYPMDAILGEEEGASGSGSTRWVIDPIDGTKSFISGVPLYSTLLSFEVDEVPQLGVCYVPALDELVYAERGGGAFWNGKPCRVTQNSNLAAAILSCGSHYSMDRAGRLPGLMDLARRTRATRTWSDAYGHILVATGRIDGMVDPILSPWDVSSVQVIVEEAGGRVTDFDGKPNPRDCAVSSNGVLHDALLGAFSQ